MTARRPLGPVAYGGYGTYVQNALGARHICGSCNSFNTLLKRLYGRYSALNALADVVSCSGPVVILFRIRQVNSN
jgi:hypothetical protein